MLLDNDVIRYVTSGRELRVIWQHNEKDTVFLIDIADSKALPFEFKISELAKALLDAQAVLIEDPHLDFTPEEQVKESHRLIRDRAMSIIGPLIDLKPSIFYSNQRWNLIKKVLRPNKTNHKTVYEYLRRYWQRGLTGNALLPDYDKSGAKGESREPGEKKRGRPRKYTEYQGVNVTNDMRKTFNVAVQRYYISNKKFTMQGCYDNMLKEFFCEKKVDLYNGYVTVNTNEGKTAKDFPTFDQFQYWVDKDNNRLDMKRKRETPRVYDLNMRGIISTSNVDVWGPGARYQIDATIADVYLLSRADRRKIIGRPVIYVVIDVYSRMIVGLYIGLEGPSWVAAMMALANAVEDKVAFCKKYGRDIEPHEWPCHHLPAIVLGDRGEIGAKTILTLSKMFNVEIENSAPYRADWKGIVEQRFKLIPAVFKPFVDGYIETDYRERGATDYRLDAVLDLEQFTSIIIECVLYYNNIHAIQNYDKDHDLAAADFAAVPIDLWEWGIANKSGALRKYPADMVKFSLMPTKTVSVTEKGIKFGPLYYTCKRAMEERWFDRARQDGRNKVEVSYDFRNMDYIYLHNPQNRYGYDECQLTPRSRAFLDLTLSEVNQAEHSSKVNLAEHAPVQKMGKIELMANTEAIVEMARAMKPDTTGVSAASRVKGIKQNRIFEKEANRQAEAFHLGGQPKPATASIPDNLLKFPGSEDDDYSEPDITQILNTGKGDGDAS